MTSFDVAALRACFPSVRTGETAFFDGPGGSQVPERVADAVRDAMVSPLANRGRTTAAERAADDIVHAARTAVADLVNADAGGVVFGRSMTQLTYDVARAVSRTWWAGDEIVVTRLDHDANIRPWVSAAASRDVRVRWADFEPATAELTLEHVQAQLSGRTRLVAVTGASNLLGTRPPVRAIADAVHAAGALLYVDGVHLTAHEPVDVAALGADFYAFSPYKLMGPHCGALVAAPDLLATFAPDKLRPSTDAVPERYELGTLPYEVLAGVTAMVDFVAELAPAAPSRRERVAVAMSTVSEHESALSTRIDAELRKLGLTVHSNAALRTPTSLATFPSGAAASDAHEFLAGLGVNAPAGSFYAIEASERIGLGAAGGLRVGVAPYTDDADVDRLLDGLTHFVDSRR